MTRSMEPSSSVAAFLAALEPSGDSSQELRRQAGMAISAAEQAWPLGSGNTTGFGTHLAARLPAQLPAIEALKELAVEDLFIAWACASGLPGAIRAFEARYFPFVRAQMRKAGAGAMVDEAEQMVRHILFMPSSRGKPPALHEYSGQGDIRSWLRVIAVREAQRVLKKTARDDGAGDDPLVDAVAPTEDPEARYLKEHFRREFVAAFRDAVAALDSRQRNVLRHHFLDGLSVDEIGPIYQVHRATAARWLSAARAEVLAGTRGRIRKRLKLATGDLRSVMGLIQSRLDISFRTLFRTQSK